MASQTARIQKRKKRWISVNASKEFNSVPLGETMAFDPASIVGRTMQINLMTLMNDPKKQSIAISFKISSVQENQAVAETIRYEVLPTHIKRMTRKDREKIEDSFICETKDNMRVRVKPVLFTRRSVKHSVATAIRNQTKAMLQEVIKNEEYAALFHLLVSNQLQKEIRDRMNKIYPLAGCEIRVLEKVAA